jgi:hypothetical protein
MKKCEKCKQKKRFTVKCSFKVGGDDSDKWVCLGCLKKELDKR